MICETILTCGVIVGGFTAHLTNEYAKETGYNWNNQAIGIDIEQKKEGVYFGGTVSTFKDSYFKRSNTELAKVGYRFNDVWAVGVAGGHVKTSYYDGAIASPYVEGCKGHFCANIIGVPDVMKNDAFVNVNFKVRW